MHRTGVPILFPSQQTRGWRCSGILIDFEATASSCLSEANTRWVPRGPGPFHLLHDRPSPTYVRALTSLATGNWSRNAAKTGSSTALSSSTELYLSRITNRTHGVRSEGYRFRGGHPPWRHPGATS